MGSAVAIVTQLAISIATSIRSFSMERGHALRLGEEPTVVEPGFSKETSYRQRENLTGEFSAMGDGILAAVDV
jgi:hypothetical protein